MVATEPSPLFIQDQEAGGKSCGISAGFFRMVKRPTATGMRMKINARHSIPNPAVAGNVPELLTPLTSVEYGILPWQ
jgi:hypothetical protein